jgi:hypothetical protein
VERDEFPPPAEDKVRKIAAIIGHDADELLALAGPVASDLTDIIPERPRAMAVTYHGKACGGLSLVPMPTISSALGRAAWVIERIA